MASRSNFGSHDMSAYRLKDMHDADYPGGVVVDPVPITAGEEIVVFYNGLLAQSGADGVYLHCGYGNADNWQGVQDMRMAKTGYGFIKTLRTPEVSTRLNFCFRDTAYNWDNNNGRNWSFEIHNG
ncbi:MAG: carbohydrate-binding protein [Desulfotomaculum sp.]|nr:carbohydrate-binding protein [Desulfotomaculum sp.]